MRIPRIYLSDSLSGKQRVHLDQQATEHVVKVLRLRKGAALVLFDGRGGLYHGVLEQAGRHDAVVSIHEFEDVSVESHLPLTLAQSISKGDRMDYTIQKAVELGVTRIVPLITERTVVHLSGERLERRLQHWRSVMIHACQQCGRNILPLLESVSTLHEFIENSEGVRLVLNHRATQSLKDVNPGQDAVTLLIGPEGGLCREEVEEAQAHGFIGIRMGPRIMRTETAAVAAIGAIQTLWGDMT